MSVNMKISQQSVSDPNREKAAEEKRTEPEGLQDTQRGSPLAWVLLPSTMERKERSTEAELLSNSGCEHSFGKRCNSAGSRSPKQEKPEVDSHPLLSGEESTWEAKLT